VFAVVCAVALAQWLYAQRVLGGLAILLALYSVARHAPRRVTLAAAVTAEAGAALAAAANGRNWLQFLALFTAMIAAPVFLGSYLRTRQAYLSALEERSWLLEHDRDQQAQIGAAAERASIAREMHDTVAHSLAVIIAKAEAAAMDQVAETGREALDKTREVPGVLRPPALAALSLPLGLDQLDALLGQVRAVGLTAELAVTGRRFPVPADAQLAIYHIVQEATANTIRHSRGATGIRVRLEYADPVIEIDITDDGQPGTGTGHRYPAGHGLAGMRELAALYGGALIAGPRPGGGWRVSAGLSPAPQAQPRPAP